MSDRLMMQFPALNAVAGLVHAFTLRHPEIEVQVSREDAIRNLSGWHDAIIQDQLGFEPSGVVRTEQVHGSRVAVISRAGDPPVAGADGMVCAASGILLGVHVADCCAVYLADPVTGAFGIVHSGKKGTEQNIVGVAIRSLMDHFAVNAGTLIVQLSPCIRPPAYEVDFAAAIRRQALEAGVRAENLNDCGICTASEPSRFYSYRMEKGKTGRMLALIGRR